MDNIIIRNIHKKKDIDKFIRFRSTVNKHDPHFCLPFNRDMKRMFNKKINPFFHHGDMELFLAEKDNEVVGRIAAIKNNLHNTVHEDKVGFFGFFESIDDQDVTNELLDAAKNKLKEWNFAQMRGPASPTLNEEYGCQYSGFEFDQVILSTHNAPYYVKLYEGYGLEKEIDVFAYSLPAKLIFQNTKIRRAWEVCQERFGLKIVEMDPKDFNGALQKFKNLFNTCWVKNHGFIPLTDAEMDFMANDLKAIADPRLILFGEINGETVAGMIVLPDYNGIFKNMNGRIFPFNWIKIFTQKKRIKALRIVILGVDPAHQKKGIDGALYYEIVKRALDLGYDWAEASYILENNYMMMRPLEMIGGEIYKKYRVFQKDI